MRKKQFNETQILAILKEGSSGIPAPDLCRKYGIGNSTYYKWKSQYAGMNGVELKRLKHLEEENKRLKHMYAELSIDHKILKDVVEKKVYQPLAEEN